MDILTEKEHRLRQRLSKLESVLVAYSGGVDSAYLAWCARHTPGLDMLAVLADSPSLARSQLKQAVAFAENHGIPLEIIETSEMENADYVKNDVLRCFHCKNELFTKMDAANRRLAFRHLAYGMNVDDQADIRPGQRAALEHGVVAPLVEAGLTKAEIRILAREAGLQVWDKPASACLSSRIAYGTPVTVETLARVEQGEEFLRGLGLRQFRVRDHNGLARIEIDADELAQMLTPTFVRTLATTFEQMGFTYVTLDCQGFRSGSMNAGSSARAASTYANRLS